MSLPASILSINIILRLERKSERMGVDTSSQCVECFGAVECNKCKVIKFRILHKAHVGDVGDADVGDADMVVVMGMDVDVSVDVVNQVRVEIRLAW